MKKFIQEFKAFAVKGNVIDLAVAVIIGGAFGKIISSLVADIIMPPIGLLSGGINLVDRQWTLRAAEGEAAAVTLNIGKFLQNVMDFLIIAVVIFLLIKLITALERQVKLDKSKATANKEATPLTPPPPTKDQELLTEIRDLLREKNTGR